MKQNEQQVHSMHKLSIVAGLCLVIMSCAVQQVVYNPQNLPPYRLAKVVMTQQAAEDGCSLSSKVARVYDWDDSLLVRKKSHQSTLLPEGAYTITAHCVCGGASGFTNVAVNLDAGKTYRLACEPTYKDGLLLNYVADWDAHITPSSQQLASPGLTD